MSDQMKLGAVLVGGYLLGRTKKGGTALRLALRMAMSGTNASPRELVQGNAMRLVQSPETQAIIEGLRAQIMDAASAALDARVNQLASSLTDRTEALKNPASKATETASGTVTGVTDKITDTEDKDEEEQDDEQGKQEDPEAEGEAEDREGEGEGEDAGSEDEAASAEESEESEDSEAVEEPEDEDEESNDPSTYADDGVDLSERIEELMKLRITSLRRMARELRYEDEDIAETEKRDLAEMVAQAEAEDEAEEDEEPDRGEEPEPEDEAEDEPDEEPEPKPAKKSPAKKSPAKKSPAKKTAKKSAAKKTAKKSTTKKAAR